jgi:ParB family chromosome partitioning protein
MKVLIQDIIINDRVRTDIGDLKPLMESLRDHGQLNPVTLSRENELIAGHRRTLAARELGWKYIEASIVDKSTEADKLQLELEENVHRKDFSPEELLAGYRRLDRLLHPPLATRIGRAIGGFFRRLFPWGRHRGGPPAAAVARRLPEAGEASPPAGNNTRSPDPDAGSYGV